MDRISTATKAVDLFGAGKHGWKDGNVAGGIVPTDFNAEWVNGAQEELLAIIEAAGIAPAAATRNQVQQAIEIMVRRQAALVCVAAGTADAITGDFTPDVTALTAGMRVSVRAGAANATTTPTFKADGTAVKTIVKGNNLPLAIGDIAGAGHWLELQYDLTLDKYVLLNPAAGVITAGRLLNVRVITATGTYTPTVGTQSVVVEVQGGGGGGGSSGATGAGQLAAGAGGNGGSYAKSRFTAAFSGVTVTVGAAGTGGTAGGNGGTGGTSSFGALVSAPGGAGGTGSPAVAPPAITPPPPNSAIASGGNMFNASSQTGSMGLMSSTSYALSGAGAGSVFGAGPSGTNSPAGGGVASNYGCGGAGGLTGASSGANSGGVGAQGVVIIWEFA